MTGIDLRSAVEVIPRSRRALLPVREIEAVQRPEALTRTWHVLGFVTVLAIAVAVRLWRLDAVGFNSDEAVYAGQAASITGDTESLEYFPVFRAHPLLFHATVSLVFELVGVSDLAARLTAVAFGIANVVAAVLLGTELYGRRVGLVGGLLVAVMPYHVIVSRQVLLDGPQAFLVAMAVWSLARYVNRGWSPWLYAAALFLGLSVLAKETSIVLAASVFAFFALSPAVALGWRRMVMASAIFVAVVAAYPMSLRLAGATGTGGAFIAYQLFRRPNHGLDFYPLTVPPAIGLGVVAAALVAAVVAWRRVTWRETLVWTWVAVPVLFFELFPVKGYQYLLPAATPLAVAAAWALVHWPEWTAESRWSERWSTRWRAWRWPASRWLMPRWQVPRRHGPRRPVPRWLPAAVITVVALTALVPTLQSVSATQRDTALAGTGGLPGGRELGAWIGDNVPTGVTMMTIGPSMANVIKWYGHRDARGLSVSPNPLYRNPVYDPIPNPDLAIRRNQVQYVVWDSFSAERSRFFSEAVLRYADRYSGREVYRQEVHGTDDEGRPAMVPIIIVYEVRP
ncbi:ArnT family glycosyltransferase [Oryzobacter terrae]|uniref:ArnT family glycosyltransferase n=1 Tax=Oryzobacter terrae TaxID=1620385 RepID=UPI00366E285D